MPRYNKQEDFEAGIKLITPFFDAMGYVLNIPEPYRDRDVLYYAHFSLPPRRIELLHHYSLASVRYCMSDYFIEHTPYLEALGVASAAHYPTYEDDSLAGYPALLQDLRAFLTPYFTGSVEEFAGPASLFMQQKRQSRVDEERRFAYWGSQERQAKARARTLFFQKRYDEVVLIGSQIRFHDFLTEPERQLFALARKRVSK